MKKIDNGKNLQFKYFFPSRRKLYCKNRIEQWKNSNEKNNQTLINKKTEKPNHMIWFFCFFNFSESKLNNNI
ncbi:hypothetical protein [Empedobacter brevis]|uniref:hypothetical protein n=1 Tax=Empedobacter brevis TaxID=247 RepID=UPI0028A8DF06|nr:hypothetical protein [Empedobacter brevis]